MDRNKLESTVKNIEKCLCLMESIRTAEKQLQVGMSKLRDEKEKERKKKKEDRAKKHENRVKEIEKSNRDLHKFFHPQKNGEK